MSQQLK